jgi:hypothetical protein
MESVYHIVTIFVNETSWAHVWRLRSLYLGTGYDIGLRDEVKLTSVERFKEESVTKKNGVGKDGSLIDEGKMKPMTEDDLVKGSDTIQTDWRLSHLECIKDPGKTTEKVKH